MVRNDDALFLLQEVAIDQAAKYIRPSCCSILPGNCAHHTGDTVDYLQMR